MLALQHDHAEVAFDKPATGPAPLSRYKGTLKATAIAAAADNATTTTAATDDAAAVLLGTCLSVIGTHTTVVANNARAITGIGLATPRAVVLADGVAIETYCVDVVRGGTTCVCLSRCVMS